MGKSKPSPGETVHRRSLVKKLMLDEGVTSKAEIKHRLESDFGIVVNRQTVHNDFSAVAGGIPSDKVKEFHLDLLAIYRKRIREYDKRIEKCVSDKDWVVLTKAQSQIMKDMGMVAGNLTLIESGRWSGKEKEKKEDVQFVFGKPEVRKRVGYDEDV